MFIMDWQINQGIVLAHFAAITSVWISLQSWEFGSYNVHQGLADQPRYSFSPAVTCI